MPVLDGKFLTNINRTFTLTVCSGVGATTQMREIEASRHQHSHSEMDAQSPPDSRILALTGMSSLEDKRRAFEAGVDG